MLTNFGLKPDSMGYILVAKYAYLDSAQRGELQKLTVAKHSDKDASHGFKVIQGHRI